MCVYIVVGDNGVGAVKAAIIVVTLESGLGAFLHVGAMAIASPVNFHRYAI